MSKDISQNVWAIRINSRSLPFPKISAGDFLTATYNKSVSDRLSLDWCLERVSWCTRRFLNKGQFAVQCLTSREHKAGRLQLIHFILISLLRQIFDEALAVVYIRWMKKHKIEAPNGTVANIYSLNRINHLNSIPSPL